MPHPRSSGIIITASNDFSGISGKIFLPTNLLPSLTPLVDRALKEPDSATSSGYANEIPFTARCQNSLFQLLHVLRHLDPALAQSLVDSHDQLAAAARRYPNGLETFHEESEATAKRLHAEGATCQGEGGGYILSGDPADSPRQRRVIDAVRSGRLCAIHGRRARQVQARHLARGAELRSQGILAIHGRVPFDLYQAGQWLGSDAASLLEQIPDGDLRLFATIELAAALAGAPASSFTSMKRPHPPGFRGSDARIISARCSIGTARTESPGPPIAVPMAVTFAAPSATSNPLTISAGAANAAMFGIRSGRQESALHALPMGSHRMPSVWRNVRSSGLVCVGIVTP